jgi:hypothetical protein
MRVQAASVGDRFIFDRPPARRYLFEQKESCMRRLILMLSLFSLFAFAVPAQAATKDICFAQVPDCITFRFAEFWTDNGGLAVFGLPLTTAKNEKVGDQKYKVQYFERARFEYHKGDPLPYDVLLGRIGVDRLTAQGRDWQTFPKADPNTPHYFAETGHAIAPQFWGFWSSHGLEFDGNKKGKSPAEALALFGMPVSEPQMEPGSDGQMYLTQWYERAKFEYHPENKAPYNVLLGRLGADVLQDRLQAKSDQPEEPAGLPGIPEIYGICAQNEPPSAEGAQAWVTEPAPNAPGIDDTICGRLIVNGVVVSGAQVTASAQYPDHVRDFGPSTTGADGVVALPFNIKILKNKFVVEITMTFTAPDGTVYTAATNFRPRYSLEEPAQPSGPGLPNIPAPTGNCAANALTPVEGAQAWMTTIQPTNPNQFDSICARLILNGAVVNGARVKAIAYRFGKDAEYGPAYTHADGVAELGFPLNNAHNHYIVYIDVSIRAPGGKTYTATTFFRPDYPVAP